MSSPYKYILAGFTLIELMISMVLGMLIVMTAFAGLRTVSQAISRSNSLALENRLLRSGMQMALEEADFWTYSDDPENATKQPLRAVSRGAGMPFTPFEKVSFIDNNTGLDESHGGWNSNPLAWAAWDSRTWVQANTPEIYQPRGTAGHYSNWGNYSIYENLTPSRSWHQWYGGQVLGLIDGLGFWGMHEYMPSNSFFIYHTDNQNQYPKGARTTGISYGGCPIALLRNDDWWANQDGSDHSMKGRVRNTNGANYFMPGPQAATAAMSRSMAKIGYEGRDSGFSIARINEFLARCGPTVTLLTRRPEHWSNVTFSVQRFMGRAQFFTVCKVESVHPLTGEKLSFSFTTVSTTLRGARQQRRNNIGWADPFSGPTLDYNQPNPLP
jgi:type II secretory pathway pseudopilin PulG